MYRNLGDPRSNCGQKHMALERLEPQSTKLHWAASVRHAKQYSSAELVPEEPLTSVVDGLECIHGLCRLVELCEHETMYSYVLQYGYLFERKGWAPYSWVNFQLIQIMHVNINQAEVKLFYKLEFAKQYEDIFNFQLYP